MSGTQLWRACVAGGMLLGPALTSGQPPRELKLTPYVGVYAPATKLARMNMTVDGTTFRANISQQIGFAAGATGSYWWTERVGFELGGAYVRTDASGTFRASGASEVASESERARVLLASARLMVGIVPIGDDAQLRFGVGPAIVNHGGKAYRAGDEGKFTGLTHLGGAVSLCTRIPMTELLAIRLRAEDYMYQSQLKVRAAGLDATQSVTFDKRFQHDFMLSAGLQLGFRR